MCVDDALRRLTVAHPQNQPLPRAVPSTAVQDRAIRKEGCAKFRAQSLSTIMDRYLLRIASYLLKGYDLCPNSVFTDSLDKTRIVKTPRIVPNGMKMHSTHAVTNANM